jgi:hypothetical protein
MLKETDKRSIVPILNQILATTETYNNIFNEFNVYITGSSLNIIDRNYQDIDIMVTLPEQKLIDSKQDLLKDIFILFKNGDITALKELKNDPKVTLLDIINTLNQTLDFLNYQLAIKNQNREFLSTRFSSENEIHRILMDPEPELQGIKMRVEGILDEEKTRPTQELDGSAGYQYGPLVECFLKDITSILTRPDHAGNIYYVVQWSKSFSEGYGKLAGENNCHIYSKTASTPIHLFMTTGVDYKKAMEKKDSFMIEYYSEKERLQPILLLG